MRLAVTQAILQSVLPMPPHCLPKSHSPTSDLLLPSWTIHLVAKRPRAKGRRAKNPAATTTVVAAPTSRASTNTLARPAELRTTARRNAIPTMGARSTRRTRERKARSTERYLVPYHRRRPPRRIGMYPSWEIPRFVQHQCTLYGRLVRGLRRTLFHRHVLQLLPTLPFL